jgi:hypothetical protein
LRGKDVTAAYIGLDQRSRIPDQLPVILKRNDAPVPVIFVEHRATTELTPSQLAAWSKKMEHDYRRLGGYTQSHDALQRAVTKELSAGNDSIIVKDDVKCRVIETFHTVDNKRKSAS